MKGSQMRQAIELRRKGFSLNEISVQLSVSKSTASLWTKNVLISTNGIKRIKDRSKKALAKSSETLHARKLNRIKIAEIDSMKLINPITPNMDNSITALSMMYWCEGSKNGRSVCFTNSDPDLVKLFITLFRKCFKIREDKIRIGVHLHDYHNETEILKFWSSVIDVPPSQFNKTFIKQSNHIYKKEGYKGCVNINYHDAHIARVIQSFAKNLTKLYI
jgi:hypothetical protein